VRESRRHGRRVDWADLRARLERAAASAEAALHKSPERVAALLDERARALARAPDETRPAAEAFDAILFVLAGGTYAVETEVVRTVLPSAEIVHVPLAPDVLVGIANVRGEALPVFDLARLFGLADAERASHTNVVVFGEHRPEFAVLVDRLLGVRRFERTDLVEPPDAGRLGALARGLTAEAIVVLDGGALLADERLFIDAGDSEAGGSGSGFVSERSPNP
jgi:purine-binding chemotaxis protein CheW